jgi:N-acetylglucosamine-6-phosphate deacetylase
MKYFRVHRLVNHDETVENAAIGVDGGVIAEIVPFAPGAAPESVRYAVPGFVDIHLHGYGGYGVMDGSAESLSGMAAALLQKGTTSFCASTVTAPVEELGRILAEGREFMRRNAGSSKRGLEASCLGFHLEGPWIAAGKAGAQNESFVREPGPESFALIDAFGGIVRVVTLSYGGAMAGFLDRLKERGIIAAAGHDDTPDYLALEGFGRGISHITHIYCMSSSFQRREGRKHLGTLEMALMTDGVSVEVIADDHHITRYFWEFIRHNKKPDDILLASDAIPVAGLKPAEGKEFSIGGVGAIVEDGVAWTADRSLYAGSVSCMHDMFRIAVKEWDVSMEDAVRFASYNPARKLGLDASIGRLAPGMAADVVFLGEDLSIASILKSGHEIQPPRGGGQ